MKNRNEISIRFVGLPLSEAGLAARSLREAILDSTPDVEAELKKDDPRTMDLGATIIAVLGTASIATVAKGIARWLAGSRQSITIEKDGTKVTFTGSVDVTKNTVELADALGRIFTQGK